MVLTDTQVPSLPFTFQVFFFFFSFGIDTLSAQSMIISLSNGHQKETISVVKMSRKPPQQIHAEL